jgi:hypothetical protein
MQTLSTGSAAAARCVAPSRTVCRASPSLRSLPARITRVAATCALRMGRWWRGWSCGWRRPRHAPTPPRSSPGPEDLCSRHRRKRTAADTSASSASVAASAAAWASSGHGGQQQLQAVAGGGSAAGGTASISTVATGPSTSFPPAAVVVRAGAGAGGRPAGCRCAMATAGLSGICCVAAGQRAVHFGRHHHGHRHLPARCPLPLPERRRLMTRSRGQQQAQQMEEAAQP